MQNMNYECKKKNRFSPYIPIRGGFSLFYVHVRYTLMHSYLIKYKSASESHPKKLILHESKKHMNMKGVKGAETKTLLREAAFKLFLTYDYNTVSLKQIEQKVNVSRGCLSYHYPNKQEMFIDVIDFYVLHKQDTKYKNENSQYMSLMQFLKFYIDKVSMNKHELSIFLEDSTQTNITRAYLNLISQAERYYPDFSKIAYEIKTRELLFWKMTIKKAQENGEIKANLDSLCLAKQFRYLFLGESYDDALENGLNIQNLEEQFMFLYSIIKK